MSNAASKWLKRVLKKAESQKIEKGIGQPTPGVVVARELSFGFEKHKSAGVGLNIDSI